MNILLNQYQSKGFLLIELLVALGIMAMLAVLISGFSLQIASYKQAAQQLYQATNLCETIIEELWSGQRPLNSHGSEQIDGFIITTNIAPVLANKSWQVLIQASWINSLKQNQKIKFEAICIT